MSDEISRAAYHDQNPYASPSHAHELPEPQNLGSQIGRPVTARFTYSGDYLVEALARYRAHFGGRFLSLIWRAVAIAAGLAGAAMAVSQQNYLVGLLLAAFLVLMLFGRRVDNWRSRRALRSSPHLNEELTLHLSDADFHARSAIQDTRYQWSAFSKVVFLDDGVLIFQGPKMFHWIPFASLIDGSGSYELESLLRAKIPEHDDLRSGR